MDQPPLGKAGFYSETGLGSQVVVKRASGEIREGALLKINLLHVPRFRP
jgi:hypothetical protein